MEPRWLIGSHFRPRGRHHSRDEELPSGHNRLVATRKQRRRREKEKRHDYEIVYVDSEGNEVEPDETDTPSAGRRNASANGKTTAKGSKSSSRRTRTPQPPSWKRVAKRGAIFAPLFIATVLLLGGKHMTLSAAVGQALILLVLFVPFSYFLDSLMWRSYQKKQGRRPVAKR